MRTYIIRRVLINIPVILLVITLVFFATNVLPGDFVATRIAQNTVTASADPEAYEKQLDSIRADLGLDDPVYIRYFTYLGNLAQGDFGRSFQDNEPAIDKFMDGLPYTLQLAIMTLIIGLIVSVPVGIISAIRQDTWIDYVLRFFAILAVAAPNFWVATMLLIFIVRWGGDGNPLTPGWTVPITERPLLWEDPWASLKLFIIPAVAGGLAVGAPVMRLLRSQMLEVLRQDYIRTGWAKGLRERTVIYRHALKNALIPVITIFGLTVANLLSGNVVFEFLFNIPGLGNKILNAIYQRDVPLLQTFVLFIATFVVFVNLVIDVLYAYLDPRIQYS